MPDMLGLDQHYFEVSLNLLQKIRDPASGFLPAHDRNVGGGVCLKRGCRGVMLAAISPQGRAGRLLGVRMRRRRFHHRMVHSGEAGSPA